MFVLRSIPTVKVEWTIFELIPFKIFGATDRPLTLKPSSLVTAVVIPKATRALVILKTAELLEFGLMKFLH